MTHVTSLYITLLPLQGEQEELGCRNPRVPLRSALGYAQIALFVPTSSAALGIAFKASLMLCSHLHEQSGRTRKPWCSTKPRVPLRSALGYGLLPLQGVGFPGYTRLPRVSLRLPWAKRSLGFQPVVPDNPAYQILHFKLDTLKNSPIRQFVIKIFMNIPGYSWQFLTTSPFACGPIQSTDVKQI